MNFVVIFDYSRRYVLDSLNGLVTHSVAASIPVKGVSPEVLTEIMLPLRTLNYDAIILALGNDGWIERILATFRKLDITKTVFVLSHEAIIDRSLPINRGGGEPLAEENLEILPKGAFEPYLTHLETHICDHCNLNCKACNNFSPFVRKRVPVSLEQWEQDIKRIASVYKVRKVNFLGGEPLLEPDLAKEFVTLTRKILPKTTFQLLTNGLLASAMKPDFWQTMIDNDVAVGVTIYPPAFKMFPDICTALDKSGVRYRYRKTMKFGRRLRLCENQNATLNAYTCGSGGCHHVRDGRIYKCPDAFLIKYLDDMEGTNFVSKHGILIDEAIKDPLHALDVLQEPIDLCRYCDNAHGKVLDWEKCEGEPNIKDWLIPED